MEVSGRQKIINGLVEEVKTMPVHEQRRLQQIWRSRYGYETALASLEEMARELAIERHLLEI